MSATVGVLLAAGLGTRYDPTAESLKLLQPVLTGKRAGAPIVAAAARNLRSAVGDMPAIDPATITAVAGALHAGHVTVAPVYRGQRGHPVGFTAACLNELLRSAGDRGACTVLEKFPPHLIEVNDDGILIDIDFR